MEYLLPFLVFLIIKLHYDPEYEIPDLIWYKDVDGLLSIWMGKQQVFLSQFLQEDYTFMADVWILML